MFHCKVLKILSATNVINIWYDSYSSNNVSKVNQFLIKPNMNSCNIVTNYWLVCKWLVLKQGIKIIDCKFKICECRNDKLVLNGSMYMIKGEPKLSLLLIRQIDKLHSMCLEQEQCIVRQIVFHLRDKIRGLYKQCRLVSLIVVQYSSLVQKA